MLTAPLVALRRTALPRIRLTDISGEDRDGFHVATGAHDGRTVQGAQDDRRPWRRHVVTAGPDTGRGVSADMPGKCCAASTPAVSGRTEHTAAWASH